jgi:hypothetical protein
LTEQVWRFVLKTLGVAHILAVGFEKVGGLIACLALPTFSKYLLNVCSCPLSLFGFRLQHRQHVQRDSGPLAAGQVSPV